MGRGRSSRWGQFFQWPLFCILAVAHIVLLPHLLSEHSDDVVSIVAGVAYLGLALADWRHGGRQAVGNQSGRVRS